MHLQELQHIFIERHNGGDTYQVLADEFCISKPAVGRIIKGKKPGRKVSAILHIGKTDAQKEAAKLATRARNSALRARAQARGWASMSAICTAFIQDETIVRIK